MTSSGFVQSSVETQTEEEEEEGGHFFSGSLSSSWSGRFMRIPSEPYSVQVKRMEDIRRSLTDLTNDSDSRSLCGSARSFRSTSARGIKRKSSLRRRSAFDADSIELSSSLNSSKKSVTWVDKIHPGRSISELHFISPRPLPGSEDYFLAEDDLPHNRPKRVAIHDNMNRCAHARVRCPPPHLHPPPARALARARGASLLTLPLPPSLPLSSLLFSSLSFFGIRPGTTTIGKRRKPRRRVSAPCASSPFGTRCGAFRPPGNAHARTHARIKERGGRDTRVQTRARGGAPMRK